MEQANNVREGSEVTQEMTALMLPETDPARVGNL
jgi:hypothetical protein